MQNILIIILFFSSFFLAGQEICNDLIDNDDDGLIDSFDPDCECDLDGNLISNPDFEDKEGCCASISNVDNCLEDWFVIVGTPDSYDPNCMTEEEITSFENDLGPSLESSIISIGFSGSFSEVLATCTEETILANTPYQFSIDLSAINLFNPNEQVAGELILYGFSDCQLLQDNFIYNTDICDNNVPYVELLTIDLEDFPAVEWSMISTLFTSSVDINAVCLAINCDIEAPIVGSTWAFYDNMVIFAEESFNYVDTISVDGDVCEMSFFLEVNEEDTLSYQWYYENVPIEGETNHNIELNGQNPVVEGNYQVVITGNSGCFIILEYLLEIPVLYQEEMYYICPGDSIFVLFKYFSVPGEYTFNYLDTISPCQILLKFYVELYDDFEFQEVDSMCIGDTYTFRNKLIETAGIYFDSLTTINGCDSVYSLVLTEMPMTNDTLKVGVCEGDTYEFDGVIYDETGFYSVSFLNQFGCDSSISLDLLVSNLLIGDTTFVVLGENEFYVFHEDTLREEGVYEDTISSSGGCDSLDLVFITLDIACVILVDFETGNTQCPESLDGFIHIFPEDEDVDYLVSIDGGESFSNDLFFDNLGVGNYGLIISSGENCEVDFGNIELVNVDTFSVLITNDTTITKGETILISVLESNFDAISYLWESVGEISCPTCPGISVSPDQTTIYTLLLTNEYGCTITLQVTIRLEENIDIYIPNIFTPNNDGINDVFKLFSGENDVNILELMIFDRWGNVVFEEHDILASKMTGWDGKLVDTAVSVGVYAYYVKYVWDENQENVHKGSITLIR